MEQFVKTDDQLPKSISSEVFQTESRKTMLPTNTTVSQFKNMT